MIRFHLDNTRLDHLRQISIPHREDMVVLGAMVTVIHLMVEDPVMVVAVVTEEVMVVMVDMGVAAVVGVGEEEEVEVDSINEG